MTPFFPQEHRQALIPYFLRIMRKRWLKRSSNYCPRHHSKPSKTCLSPCLSPRSTKGFLRWVEGLWKTITFFFFQQKDNSYIFFLKELRKDGTNKETNKYRMTTITLNIFPDSTFPLHMNCWYFSHYMYGNVFTTNFS